MYTRIGVLIKQAREEKRLSQAELGAFIGVTATAINYYEKGKRKINVEDLYRLAEVLEKPPGYFLPVEKYQKESSEKNSLSNRPDVYYDLIGLPVLGSVRAGKASLARQEVMGYLPYPRKLGGKQFFALKIAGDSMNGVGIYDGDLALLHRQSQVEYNGQIVCALLNGEESTLKIYFRLQDGRIKLKAANSGHEDIILENENELEIQGVLVGVFKAPPVILNHNS